MAMRLLHFGYGLLALASLVGIGAGQGYNASQVGTNVTTNATYSNPIMTLNVGDPWMLHHDDWYYLTYTTGNNITLRRSKSLTADWDNAETRTIFNPDPTEGKDYSTDLWAPELHTINGTWYIIFTATPDADSPPPLVDAMCTYTCPAVNHRMLVLKGDGDDPWTAKFSIQPTLNTFDQFAIDGTYFQHSAKLYMIYSCWQHAYDGWPAALCIVEMSDPITVASNLTDRRMISVPDQPWEQVPYGSFPRLSTNEGPEQLVNPHTGQNFVVYSAARVNTPFYCLGLLELVGDDPMQYQSWKKNTDGCVFHQNTAAGVYGTGHASFTTSPDGEENYVVYHAITTPNPSSDLYRTVRTQRFTWNDDGTPSFPLALNGPFSVPSGQNGSMGTMLL